MSSGDYNARSANYYHGVCGGDGCERFIQHARVEKSNNSDRWVRCTACGHINCFARSDSKHPGKIQEGDI